MDGEYPSIPVAVLMEHQVVSLTGTTNLRCCCGWIGPYINAVGPSAPDCWIGHLLEVGRGVAIPLAVIEAHRPTGVGCSCGWGAAVLPSFFYHNYPDHLRDEARKAR